MAKNTQVDDWFMLQTAVVGTLPPAPGARFAPASPHRSRFGTHGSWRSEGAGGAPRGMV